MIVRKIIDTFYDLAKQHKLIRSFAYDRVSKGMGTGEKHYPQFFLGMLYFYFFLFLLSFELNNLLVFQALDAKLL